MKGYKAIQESVWPKYTLYVCVRPGVLPAHVCGHVRGQVCCQKHVLPENMVFLVFLVKDVTFPDDT